METILNIKGVPIIVGLVYLVIFGYKKIVTAKVKDEKKLGRATKVIPIIAGVFGLILGIVAYYAIPDLMPASNIGSAILIGLASGLAATGTDQVVRQLAKKYSDKKEEPEAIAPEVVEPKDNEQSDSEDKE